jgi:hypothetical protein
VTSKARVQDPAGEPCDSSRLIAEPPVGRAPCGLGTVEAEIRFDGAQVVEIREPDGIPAQDDPTGRGVVRDRVAETDIPITDATIDHLDRGKHELGRAQHVAHVAGTTGQCPAEDEGDLDLDARCAESLRLDHIALEDEHIAQQMSEVGLVDAHHLLHRARGEADLMPSNLGAPGEALLDVSLLDRVGVLDIEPGPLLSQGRNGRRLALGLREGPSRRLPLLCRELAHALARKSIARRSNAA